MDRSTLISTPYVIECTGTRCNLLIASDLSHDENDDDHLMAGVEEEVEHRQID